VVEQDGRIELLDHGVQSTFLDLASTGRVYTGPASGLFSVALAPDYEASGHLYVFYTRTAGDSDRELGGDLQIDEFTATGDSVAVASRRPVLTIPQEPGPYHNGGQLQFGPDGYLYASTGDGSTSGDALETAQDLDSLHGKLLRIDPDPSGPAPYSVPRDNPFAGSTPGADEIWSYGFRNPWRFSFDRLTGDLWLGDVGESNWEEVDYGAAPGVGRGLNFGWDCREGPDAFEPDGCSGPFTEPVFWYSHAPSGSASITGGYVVRDPSLGALYGRYLYADAVAGQVRSVNPWAAGGPDDRLEFNFNYPVGFGEDSCGRLYVASLTIGVYRLDGSGPACSSPAPKPAPGPLAAGPQPVPTCGGLAATIDARDQTKVLGTPAADVIVGDPAADWIRGRGGADVICAGAGADRLRGGSGADDLRGEAGADTCHGGPGKDRLSSCAPGGETS
jgi:hypothetical protein